MFRYGMFPEPFLGQNERKARLWRRTRVERVIREDLRDLSRTLELSQVEMLASLLPERVGSPLPIAALAGLLEVSHGTVKRWISFLKELYYAFELKPYTNHVARSLKKEGKFYLWDASEVPEDAARLENLIACHLLKACDLWTDCGDGDFELHYLRDKQKNEIDFLITRDRQPWLPVEVKLSSRDPSPSWRRLLPCLPCRNAVQVCRQMQGRETHAVGDRRLTVMSVPELLVSLP